MNSLPYFEIEADATGHLGDAAQPAALTSFLTAHPVRHLFVIVHGWNSTPAAARDLYRRFFAQLSETLEANPGCAVAGAECAVAGLLWPSEQFTADILEPLNLLTYYRMKNRAGLAGQFALAGTLDSIRRAAPSVRLHLIGHSFGGRVISSAALATAEPVDSLTLLQAAFSQNSFSPDYDASHRPGYFRRVVTDRKVRGPMMISHSAHDRAVGVAYSIASRLARQNGSGIDEGIDPYAGLGHNGARNTPEASAGDLLPAGTAYELRPGGVYNLNSDRVISSHDDVARPETAWAVLAAACFGTGEHIQSSE
jgi:pimeloyl-ACP methyl ester carboxylesterase